MASSKMLSSETHTTLETTQVIVRLSTAGSVDDGKSTLIGRLLYDTGNIYDDHLEALQQSSQKYGSGALSLALLTDGLKAEREQGITIDVAYRYFSTAKRRFILADTPGHEQYTRNMATGASTAQLTIVLVDAEKGVVTQTRRHSFIAALMGVPRLLVAINKMDLVGYKESRFEEIRNQFTEFAGRLQVKEIKFIPVSALAGDNVVARSTNMPWYHGETVMEHLENVYVAGDINKIDFRFPVQGTLRPNATYRGYTGQIASGVIRPGDEVVILPSRRKSKVRSIDQMSKGMQRYLPEASAPMSVTLTIEDEIDINRGDMLVRPNNLPNQGSEFEALVVWMDQQPLDLNKRYLVRHTTRDSKLMVQEVAYRVDCNTLGRIKPAPLQMNEIGRVRCKTTSPLFFDSYERSRATGNFLLIDPETFMTAGAGMIIDRQRDDADSPVRSDAENLHLEVGKVSRANRESHFGRQARTIWCTGLSGSGKSTIASALEKALFFAGGPAYRLDGDNIRHGLNRDLGFSVEDRRENIRRVAEVAKLFNDAGITVICALISPLQRDRAMAAEIIGADSFFEVYVNAPIEICEKRDPHGLYKKVRAGKISEFTGITAPYEAPTDPALVLDTAELNVDECVQRILIALAPS